MGDDTDMETLPKESEWRRISVRTGVGYFLAFLITLLLIDAFGVKKDVAFGSATLFNRYFAGAYPHCTRKFGCLFRWKNDDANDDAGEPRRDGKQVSVVLWNDFSLNRADKVWPLRMRDHAEVLETMLAYKPKAVLVDILFADDPARRGDDSLDELLEVVREYSDNKVGLYFLETSGVKAISPLKDAADERNMLPAEVSGSPARIYPGGSASSVVYGRDYGLEVPDFYLFWGGRSDPVTKKFYGKCKRTYSPDSNSDVFPENFAAVALAAAGQVFKSSAMEEPYCPYIPTVPADVVQCLPPEKKISRDRAMECMAAVGGRADSSDVEHAITGKYVVYGVQFSGMGDVVKTPFLGDRVIGGLYVHATALDNLVASEGSVQYVKGQLKLVPAGLARWLGQLKLVPAGLARWLGQLTLESVHYYVITALVATGAFFLVGWALFDRWPRMEHYIKDKMPSSDSIWRKIGMLIVDLGYYSLVVGAVAVLLLLLTWAIYLASAIYSPLRFGVFNWTGVLLASGVLSVWAKKSLAEGLGELVGRLLHRRKKK